MEKKHSIYFPVRLTTRKELYELVYGTNYCPACDCEVVGERTMNKLPYIDFKNELSGWICDICESVFDLKDNLIQFGSFDGSDIYEA
jgi:hypothetical protein|tara:strand:+ start:433 stop:693 length:261 start_codon:yes stop_codon:yes gene_type:complete